MSHTAPIARCAVAWSAGVAAGLLGAPTWVAPAILVLLLGAPIEASWRRTRRSPLAVVFVAGLLAIAGGSVETDCVAPVVGSRGSVVGRFLASPRTGSAPFVMEDGCREFTVVVGEEGVLIGAGYLVAGDLVVASGIWRDGRRRPWFLASSVESRDEAVVRTRPLHFVRWTAVRWRDGLAGRIERLYGDRAPLVAALTLARREGLDPELREGFAVTGVAHLLAISGFHVGVFASIALALLRSLGMSRRRASLAAAALAWMYVALIGLPDSGCRAALILGLIAVSRNSGRPPSRWGALGAAGLILLVLEPRRLASAGFQLSFAGAAGLVAWARPIEMHLGRAWSIALHRRAPRTLLSAIAAGVAATLATLPIVAWHFERVSLVGIPATLLASPLVSLAPPGALASVAVDIVSPTAAGFLAGGVSFLLDLLRGVSEVGAALPFASAWVTRPTVVAALVGVSLATAVARRPGIGGRGRRRLIGVYTLIATAGWPLLVGLQDRGSLELWMIDVGQGDAIALRTPRGRWILIDAGPPSEVPSRAHPVVRALRARGVRRLEAVVITHADADHFGGVAAVLDNVAVAQVLDPALPVGKSGYRDLLASAGERGVPWRAARAGQALDIDDVTIRVLHPTDSIVAQEQAARTEAEANEASVVLLVTWRGFRALLTGDAYKDVERAIVEEAGDLDVLKVGHHGSDTSTDSTFLSRSRPEVALISVGRRNRYGHPSPAVLERLTTAGAEIRRTDLEGGLSVVVGGDGAFTVRTSLSRTRW